VSVEEKPWLKHYPPHCAPELEYPRVSLTDQLDAVAQASENRPALHFLGETLTYGDLTTLSNSLAQCLVQHGMGKGDVIGINLPNVPQYMVAQLAALKAGAAASGVSPLLTPREMAHQLRDSRAKALITIDAIFEHRLLQIAEELPDLKLVIVTGILDFLPWIKRFAAKVLKKVPTGSVRPISGKTVLHFMDILKEYPGKRPDVAVAPDDDCLVMYTGGTTGLPKGTINTHRNMVAELAIVTTWLNMRHGEEVILSAFPYFHIAGLALGLGTMYIGAVQILIPNPRDTKRLVAEMKKYEPTILVNVPSLYMMLMADKGFRKLDFSRLDFCLSAASPFPVESLRELESIIGSGKLIECYGMTEVSSLSTMNPRFGTKKLGTVGIPLPNTDVMLFDLETGSGSVPVHQEGEILVSGPQVMKGYLNKPEETALALREHGGKVWLHTGDVGKMDSDGFITIVDRAKDMLNVGGFKVFSREVEEKLYEHPAIEFCAIIGVPNPERPGTEIVKLVVQLSQGYRDKSAKEVEADIIKFARENFAPYKVPKILEFHKEMPLTSVGKVDKKALR
jgi:acyl-CoA synthetase (AMP-forming)/AMP-acid ligase II